MSVESVGADDGYNPSETPMADQMRDSFLQQGFDSFTSHLINDVKEQASSNGEQGLGASLEQAMRPINPVATGQGDGGGSSE
jgi:hypothetical protein